MFTHLCVDGLIFFPSMINVLLILAPHSEQSPNVCKQLTLAMKHDSCIGPNCVHKMAGRAEIKLDPIYRVVSNCRK